MIRFPSVEGETPAFENGTGALRQTFVHSSHSVVKQNSSLVEASAIRPIKICFIAAPLLLYWYTGLTVLAPPENRYYPENTFAPLFVRGHRQIYGIHWIPSLELRDFLSTLQK